MSVGVSERVYKRVCLRGRGRTSAGANDALMCVCSTLGGSPMLLYLHVCLCTGCLHAALFARLCTGCFYAALFARVFALGASMPIYLQCVFVQGVSMMFYLPVCLFSGCLYADLFAHVSFHRVPLTTRPTRRSMVMKFEFSNRAGHHATFLQTTSEP